MESERMMPERVWTDEQADELLPGPRQLPVAERLVLWSVRTWVAAAMLDMSPAPMIATTFRRAGACGDHAVFELMLAVQGAARRHIGVGCPGCGVLTPDEALLLSVIASVRADRTGAERRLKPLVVSPDGVTRAARTLANELEMSGFAFADWRSEHRGLSLSVH